MLLMKRGHGRWGKLLPEEWKKENGTSVSKKDKKEDPGNDRLVILTLIAG